MKKRTIGKLLTGLTATTLLAACIPLFTDGIFQTLRLGFRLDREVAAGEETLIHTAVFAQDVRVKKNFVQISGRLEPPAGQGAPTRLTVTAEIEEAGGGKVVQRISLKLDPDENGDFKAKGRLRQDVSAGEMLSVTLEPSGADLAAGSELQICVDLVKKKKDLRQLPDCLEPADAGDPDGPDDPADPQATFSSLSGDYFAPTCSQAGCHAASSARAGLVLEPALAYSNLVGVSSSQRAELDRVAAGDPENSYLVKKLRGDGDIVGAQMPLGGPFLSASEIDRFVRWIQNGAADD